MTCPYDTSTTGEGDPHNGGVTWLELYALYRLAGHEEPLRQDRIAAASRPTLRQQLHAFRQATRQVVLATMTSEYHQLAKGRQQAGKRFASLGIDTHLATLPWQPCLTTQAQEKLAIEVLRSQHRLSPDKAKQTINGHMVLATRSIQLKGRTKWSASIKPYPHRIYHTSPDHSTAQPTQHQPPPPYPAAEISRADGGPPSASAGTNPSTRIAEPGGSCSTTPADFIGHGAAAMGYAPQDFQCPRCTHTLPCTRAAFNTHNLDSRLWCNTCRRSLFVKQWRCSCGLQWHTCPRHQQSPQQLRHQQAIASEANTTNTTRSTPRSRPKRCLGQGRDEVILQWLDQPPNKRRRAAKPDIELDDHTDQGAAKRANPHCLGPKLLAKFPRLQEPTQPQDTTSTALAPLTEPHIPPPQMQQQSMTDQTGCATYGA